MFEAITNVAQKQKRCSACYETKPLSDFCKSHHTRDGLEYQCKDCRRLYRKARTRKVKRSVVEKECPQCKEVKLAKAFSIDRSRSDGLSRICKECQKVNYAARKNRDPALPKTKQCYLCGIVKPAEDFDKRCEAPDGLRGECRQCRNLNCRVRHILQRSKKDEASQRGIGIANWEQADSVVREMAELQASINQERAICNGRIVKAKTDMAEAITASVCYQARLHIALEKFVTMSLAGYKKKTRELQFGTIYFARCKMRLQLNPAKAAERLGRP